MLPEFKRRFWASLALTVPVVLLSPMVQRTLGLESLAFAGRGLIQLVLASAVFFYGGWPFLSGLFGEISHRRPGMMTLIGLATSVAFIYSAAVALGLPGAGFFWELATLIDIMLLGRSVAMRSVMGASRAPEGACQGPCRQKPVGCGRMVPRKNSALRDSERRSDPGQARGKW